MTQQLTKRRLDAIFERPDAKKPRPKPRLTKPRLEAALRRIVAIEVAPVNGLIPAHELENVQRIARMALDIQPPARLPAPPALPVTGLSLGDLARLSEEHS